MTYALSRSPARAMMRSSCSMLAAEQGHLGCTADAVVVAGAEAGDGRGVENVVWGQRDGLDIKAFEYWYYEDSSDAEGHTSRDYSHFSCTVVPTAVSCPHTAIAPEGVLSRLGRALGFHDIEFESEEFNKAMKVNSADPKFATYLVDARMMQWLLDNKGWHFELCDRWLLAYRSRTKPKLIWGVIEAAREFHQHIPNVIEETYREGS